MQFFHYDYYSYFLRQAPQLFNSSEMSHLSTAACGDIDEADNNYAEEKNPK